LKTDARGSGARGHRAESYADAEGNIIYNRNVYVGNSYLGGGYSGGGCRRYRPGQKAIRHNG